MKDIQELLSSLQEHGTIDSEGEFTVSLSEARRKLTQYHASEPHRYLLLLISGGIAAGAQSIEIGQGENLYKLQMPGAYIPEQVLLNAFSQPSAEVESPGAGDLVLAFQSAFSERASQIDVYVSSSQRESYQWHLTPEGEEHSPFSGTKDVLEIVLTFRRVWMEKVSFMISRTWGYASLRPEGRLVDRHCDRAQVPIWIAGNRVNRPYFLMPAQPILTARVGNPTTVSSLEPDLQLDDYSWKGALALSSGRVQAVIHGVSYCQFAGTGLSGIVYHDLLRRDLSREKVVHDAIYTSLMIDLEEIRLKLLAVAACRLPLRDLSQVDEFCDDLLLYSLTGRLAPQAQECFREWVGQNIGSRCHDLPLVEQYFRIGHRPERARIRFLKSLLEECALQLDDERGRERILEQTLSLLRKELPEESLLQGYLLLGLGAHHSLAGDESKAEETWFEALRVVWSGQDQQAQELVYAHMGYGAEHIIGQTAAALRMGLRDLD